MSLHWFSALQTRLFAGGAPFSTSQNYLCVSVPLPIVRFQALSGGKYEGGCLLVWTVTSLVMEAASISETLLNLNVLHNNPEGSHLN
jgi:hypothetical protein